jgi:hypothetical protein
MKTTSMDLFQILKTKTGERETRALIDYMEDKLDDRNREFQEMCLNTFATKAELREEIAKVREDLVRVEGRLETKVTSFEGRLETKVTSFEGRLETKITSVESRLGAKITSMEGQLETKITSLEGQLETKTTSLEGRLTTKIAEVEGRLEVKIVEVKSDIIRWMFGLFVAILIAILGIYLKK